MSRKRYSVEQIINHLTGTGYVFRSTDGERVESFKKGFDALCKDAGILHDRYGDKRAPYSLRHTYATSLSSTAGSVSTPSPSTWAPAWT